MYKALVGAGWVTPTEFWNMHPCEFWWLIEAKMPPAEKVKVGNADALLAKLERWQADELRLIDS